MDSKVFVNRTLNMKRISHIGLDMDHTLVRYNSRNFEELTHEVVIDKLVERHGYPKEIKELSFDWDIAIRGLVLDKKKGNLLKLSRYGAIRASQHGLKAINYNDQKKIYKSTYVDLGDPEYESVDTAFSIAFAGLFAQLIEFKNSHANGSLLPDFTLIADDLNKALDGAHRDGSLKGVVAEDLGRYILKDESVVRGIQRYLKHGKKFFVVTNSDYEYTKLLLDFAINPFLQNGETWEDLFDVVITLARKPRFFYDNQGFLKIDTKTGAMTNVNTNKITNGVYQGGSATKFTEDLGIEPDQILYLGDHIYGDILRLKKDCAWRTALIVEEIEDEIGKMKKSKSTQDEIDSLMEQKLPMEKELDDLITKKIESDNFDQQSQIDDLLGQVAAIDKKISPLIKDQIQHYNPHWGELMRAGIEESYFAYQVERFACIYMAKLSDLLELSPRTYFRSRKRSMAHDI